MDPEGISPLRHQSRQENKAFTFIALDEGWARVAPVCDSLFCIPAGEAWLPQKWTNPPPLRPAPLHHHASQHFLFQTSEQKTTMKCALPGCRAWSGKSRCIIDLPVVQNRFSSSGLRFGVMWPLFQKQVVMVILIWFSLFRSRNSDFRKLTSCCDSSS